MTAITMAWLLRSTLGQEVYSSVKKSITRAPILERCFLNIGTYQYVCAIQYNNKPHGVFLLANPGNGKEADKLVRSVLPEITRDYPSIKIAVQLQLRGLDSKIRRDNKDIEDRVRRISQQSCIEVWAHNGVKFSKDYAFSAKSLPGDGELHLPLPGEDAKIVPVLQFSEVLQVIREYCKQGHPLLGHPDPKDSLAPNDDNNKNKGLGASVFPLEALKSGFEAGITQLLAPHSQEHKAGGLGSKAPFSSLSGGAALATRRGMLPPTGTPGLGPIKARGTARNTVTSLLSAGHLVGRLIRR